MTAEPSAFARSERVEPAERRLVEALRRADRAIALLERVQPHDVEAERARLSQAWRSAHRLAPQFRYGRSPDLSEIRRLLELVAGAPASSIRIELCAERARELDLEARLVESIGTPGLVEISRLRHAPGAEDLIRAEDWAREWLELARPEPPGSLHVSDDASDPESLLSVLERAIGGQRLPIRIEVRRDVSATAATGDGVIRIRPGVRLGARDAERIALHEIGAHALPRILARTRPGIEAVGSAGASDDEEGRAILLEARAGFLDDARKIELGRRHLAALAVREGRSFVETVELLLAHRTPLEAAIDLACRVFRGGGLAREVVYLTAYARVTRAFDADQELEPLVARARLSVEAARRLANSR